MTRPEGWPVVSELASPDTWLGLRFTDQMVENAYQSWPHEHVRTFAQFAMYGGAGAAFCAWIAVLFGALTEARGLALALIPGMMAIMVLGAVASGREGFERLVMPLSAGVNLLGGASRSALPIRCTSRR